MKCLLAATIALLFVCKCYSFSPSKSLSAASTTRSSTTTRFTTTALFGKRKMRVTPAENDASAQICEVKWGIPVVTAYVAFQVLIPSISTGCAADLKIPDPTGFCPVEYWNPGAIAPGILLFLVAAFAAQWIQANRLVFFDTGIALVPVSKGELLDEDPEIVQFQDIVDWKMNPLGLQVETAANDKKFFWGGWDDKTVSELLEKALE